MRRKGTLRTESEGLQEQQPVPPVITSELLESLRLLLAQTTMAEETTDPTLLLTETEQETNNSERVKAYLAVHPQATLREIAEALTISVTTAKKWRTRIQGEGVQEEHI